MSWVSPREYAKHHRISINTVKSRVRRGAVQRREITKGSYQYWIDDADEDAPGAKPSPPVEIWRGPEKPKPHDSTRVWKIASIWDVHVPDHDLRLWASFLAWCEDEQPDEVIIGGDFLELESASQHGGVSRPALLREDIDAGATALRQLRQANPDAVLTYLEGNHEDRFSRIMVRNIPTFDGATSIPEMLPLRELDIQWLPENVHHWRGNLAFLHGLYTNQHHAAKHARELPGMSMCYGHTHRPESKFKGYKSRDGSNKSHGVWGMPCMREIDDVGWMKGRPHGWSQGFGVHYIRPGGDFNTYVVIAFDGVFTWHGKTYGQ